MVIVYDDVLVIRNARDKVQVAKFKLILEGNSYIIERYTGQHEGKFTKQPDKQISVGKAKRSVLMQAELEYNSLIKKSLDKGYKRLSSLTKIKYEDITTSELDSLVPSIKTDANGNIKPQLAKSSNDCTINVWDKEMFCSRKIDGVRALFRWDPNKEKIVTISRGGKDYDISTTHLRNDKLLIDFFKENPSIILDGEIYKHGWPLQKISGTARLQKWEPKCANLEYWIYDIADPERDFNSRLDTLIDLGLYFKDHEKIKIVEHILCNSWIKVKKLHDKYVSEGFEGLVARKPFKFYQLGKRNSDWIKVKDYQDSEFEILGIEEGLRDEDMCFVLKADNGKTFKAKPIGSRELRLEYLENWEYYVGKMATVKYFSLSTDGIPTQPIFKSIREEGE